MADLEAPVDSEVEAADEAISENIMLLAQRNPVLLLLTLKERHRFTQSAINFSVGQLKQMVYHVLQDVKQSVQEQVGVDVAINDCFDVGPFQGLETEHLQTKFYRDHFNLRVSSVFFFLLFCSRKKKKEKKLTLKVNVCIVLNSTTKVCMSFYVALIITPNFVFPK